MEFCLTGFVKMWDFKEIVLYAKAGKVRGCVVVIIFSFFQKTNLAV